MATSCVERYKTEENQYHSVSQHLQGIMRRRENPNWGHVTPYIPKGPTEFELLVKRLRLTQEKYTSSPELKQWCKSNRNRCYVPEWLLEEWGLEVEINYGL